MAWILLAYLVLLIALPVLAARGSSRISFSCSLNYFVAGFIVGAVGLIIATGILQTILSPQLLEFDLLVYLFYAAPVGGLLGGLTGLMIYLGQYQGQEGKLQRLLSLGSLPVAGLAIYSVYDFFIGTRPYLVNETDILFWLLTYGLPLFWIVALWFRSGAERRKVLQ